MYEFFQGCFRVVKKILSGRIMSYKQVTEKANYPLDWRTVGNVLNKDNSRKIFVIG